MPAPQPVGVDGIHQVRAGLQRHLATIAHSRDPPSPRDSKTLAPSTGILLTWHPTLASILTPPSGTHLHNPPGKCYRLTRHRPGARCVARKTLDRATRARNAKVTKKNPRWQGDVRYRTGDGAVGGMESCNRAILARTPLGHGLGSMRGWKTRCVQKRTGQSGEHSPLKKLRYILIRMSEHWASYRVFDW